MEHEPSGPSREERFEQAFEEATPRPIPAGYETDEGRLDAVAARRKAMDASWWPATVVRDGDDAYLTLLEQAAARGLSVLQIPDADAPDVPGIRVYVLPPENTWRALAHAALWHVYPATGPWSHQAEDLEGFLLGYTDEERRSWRAGNEWARASWAGETIYFLMDHRSIDRCAALGSRCLHPDLAGNEVLIAHVRSGWVARADGVAILAPTSCLARAAVRRPVVDEVFGRPATRSSRPAQVRPLTAELITVINRALVSGLEVLTADGWRGGALTAPG